MSIYDLKKKLRLKDADLKQLTSFQTVAGFMLAHLDKIPKPGDFFERSQYRFEVVDMDHNRVDKILVKKIASK